MIKEPTVIDTIRLNILRWFGHEQVIGGNRIPQRVLYTYMNLESTILRGKPRNRLHDEGGGMED